MISDKMEILFRVDVLFLLDVIAAVAVDGTLSKLFDGDDDKCNDHC